MFQFSYKNVRRFREMISWFCLKYFTNICRWFVSRPISVHYRCTRFCEKTSSLQKDDARMFDTRNIKLSWTSQCMLIPTNRNYLPILVCAIWNFEFPLSFFLGGGGHATPSNYALSKYTPIIVIFLYCRSKENSLETLWTDYVRAQINEIRLYVIEFIFIMYPSIYLTISCSEKANEVKKVNRY